MSPDPTSLPGEEGRRRDNSLLGDSGHVDMLGTVVRHCERARLRRGGSRWVAATTRANTHAHTHACGERGETRGQAVSPVNLLGHSTRADSPRIVGQTTRNPREATAPRSCSSLLSTSP